MRCSSNRLGPECGLPVPAVSAGLDPPPVAAGAWSFAGASHSVTVSGAAGATAASSTLSARTAAALPRGAAHFGSGAGLSAAWVVSMREKVSEAASDTRPPPTVPRHTQSTTLLTSEVAPAVPLATMVAAAPVKASARRRDALGTASPEPPISTQPGPPPSRKRTGSFMAGLPWPGPARQVVRTLHGRASTSKQPCPSAHRESVRSRPS